jgi:hypothetical protein
MEDAFFVLLDVLSRWQLRVYHFLRYSHSTLIIVIFAIFLRLLVFSFFSFRSYCTTRDAATHARPVKGVATASAESMSIEFSFTFSSTFSYSISSTYVPFSLSNGSFSPEAMFSM